MGSGGGYGLSFGNTRGGVAAGDVSYMGSSDRFLHNIRNRSDVDPGGKFDVIAHGTPSSIEIEHNGTKMEVNSRTAAQMIKRLPGYKRGQAIRLLSCSTGTRSDGFAQNLANKLNATVYAPSDILWAYPSGRHIIAAAKPSSRDPNVMVPDLRRTGRFVKYTPGGNR